MPTFRYRAAAADGRTVRGVEPAASPETLERLLGERGLYPVEVAVTAERAGEPGGGRRGWRGRGADVADAMRYLATLLGAGFPLDRALGAVARAVVRTDVADALLDVRARVRAGAHLGDALAGHPHVFPPVAAGMARAGERGGDLGATLARLATQLEREQAMRARLVSAAIYPAVMLVTGLAAVAVLFLVVLPRLVAMLEDAGAPVPPATALLLGAADALRAWWPALVLAGALAPLVLAAYRRTSGGAEVVDRALLAIPVIGALRRQRAAARLGRTLGALLGAGLPVLSALEIAAGALGDAAARASVMRAREEVRAGGRIAPALARGGVYPYLFLQVVGVGEEGGRLAELLERAADMSEEELARGLDRLVRLTEPLLIVLLGGAVGAFALGLLQAVYGVRANIG